MTKLWRLRTARELENLSAQLQPIPKLFLVHTAIVVLCSFAFRFYLLTQVAGAAPQNLLISFGLGFLFDLATAIFTFSPIALFILSSPRILLLGGRLKLFLAVLVFTDLAAFAFGFCCEYFFFDEFKDRFNFIAVDYLVYTHEVLENIWESYPVLSLLGAIFLFAGICTFLIFRLVSWPSAFPAGVWSRAFAAVIYSALVVISASLITERHILPKANPFAEMVGKNGLFALFAAYRMNEIDFDKFYTGMDSGQAAEHVHELLEGSQEESEDFQTEDEASIVRNINPKSAPKKLNVVLVVMESLSARYMEYYGNKDNITPNLDNLIKESIFFNRMYATGTRTVRGLEAILLSLPPTPGQSVVRRPAGESIFNLGQVFRENGYHSSFIYGGRAAFDNMGAFFSGNGYSVIDQTNFASNEIEFSNAWGVSDEDLFKKVIQISDERFRTRKPFFHTVLTTSNHRPYTFPAGKVSRAPGSGRLAAVQYSDFAIGEFLNSARTKPWYSSTVFVFIADHNAAVSGGTKILPEDYLVPLLIFAPGNFEPRIVAKLGSQIDIAPTVLGLLNLKYQSRFFGLDLMTEDPKRAFLSTYQKIAYLTEDSLTVLSPVKRIEHSAWIDGKILDSTSRKVDLISVKSEDPLRTTVAYYKVASTWFRENLLEAKLAFDRGINLRR